MTDAERLRAVEEAVIEFKSIASTIVVDHKKRLEKLEEADKKFIDSVNTSCTIKDKQIADGDSKTFWRCMGVVGSLFLLFIGAVVYFNNMDGKIFTRLNDDYAKTIKVETLTDTVLKKLDKLDVKMDEVTKHHHDNSALMERINTIEKYQYKNYGFLQGSKGDK